MTALRARGLSDDARSEEFERYKREHHALALVVESGDVEAVRRALASGADPHSVDVLGSPVLHIAAAGGQVEIMQLLVEAGADVDIRDDYLSTALILAANGAQRAAVEFLLAQGADPRLRNDLGESAEDRAARGAADPELVPLLREAVRHGRVRCACGARILPSTAERTGGKCVPCSQGWSPDRGKAPRVIQLPRWDRLVRVWVGEEGPSAGQLAAIRGVVPSLREMSPHLLRTRLSEWRVSVLGEAEPDAIVELRAAGLTVERVEPEGYEHYVVDHAPPPSHGWAEASHALEIAALPSFANEAVLRLWSVSGRGRVQIAESGIHTWQRLFNASPWCLGIEDGEPAEPDPFEESAEARGGVEGLVERAIGLAVEPPNPGILDGISYLLRARSPAGEIRHRGHCPSPTHQGTLYELLSDVFAVARKEVRHPRSREVLNRAM